ncbi:MAG TPA: bile acid:sodium symporter family protein [Cyclobacteriaceae bacterium]|nr:bile acid:sodium symporter family protein [Cyclobacteriaceae bacterium]
MNKYPKVFFALAGLFLIVFAYTSFSGIHAAGWFLMGFFASMAIAFRGYELLKGYSYTITILAAASMAMYYPTYFITVGDFKLSSLIRPLLQIIMFGMGTSLSWRDFAAVVKMPKGVIAGVLCHYIIMPTVAFIVTLIFQFPPEISAGIILVGSCPNGLASNVMTYLAKANLALSVTLTAISTFLAPFVTPLFMQWLGGQYIDVDVFAMLKEIVYITIIPIVAGLIFNHFLHGKFKVLDSIMPLLSMGGIALIIVVITASGRDNLLAVGPLLVVAVLMHNLSGYFLGYWSSKWLLRMPEVDCRTIAIEVGLQNAGLASGLANAMGKMATVGLAAAVFGPTMNITGSTLALWWRSKPISEEQKKN